MISIQADDFDVAAVYHSLANSGNAGAVAMFVGLVRDLASEGDLQHLFLEHYPGMAEQQIANILAEANTRWDIIDHRIIHRVGELKPHEQIVFVGISSTHRQDSFAACEFIMDHLKSQVAFWKKEQTTNDATWLTPREQDHAVLERWKP